MFNGIINGKSLRYFIVIYCRWNYYLYNWYIYRYIYVFEIILYMGYIVDISVVVW